MRKLYMKQISRSQKILILRPEGSLGDAVLTSPYYSSLKAFDEKIEISVFCLAGAKEYLSSLKEISYVYSLKATKLRKHQHWIKLFCLALLLRIKNFDLIIDDNPPRQMNWKIFRFILDKNNFFTPKLKAEETYPIQNRVKSYIANLGIPFVKYNFTITERADFFIQDFLTKNKIGNFVVLNCFGSVQERCFNEETLRFLIKIIFQKYGLPIVLPCQASARNKFNFIQENIFWIITSTCQELFALIADERNLLTLSPDTSIVHIAASFEKPIIAFFQNKGGYPTDNKNAVCIYSKDNNINNFEKTEVEARLL